MKIYEDIEKNFVKTKLRLKLNYYPSIQKIFLIKKIE
tara:strand:+ start:2598 stop:2708 length:111 start_codon:yes stop_codon:yes gene_type:complete